MINQASQLRIFLVEDTVDLREEMIFGLTAQGFAARGFGEASELYRALAIEGCDIVVIDVGLPGEDGISIAKHLRQKTSTGIVFLSSRNRLEDRLLGLDVGADAYLVKPIDVRELAATLRAVSRRISVKRDVGLALAQNASAPEGWRMVRDGWVLCNPYGYELMLTNAERRFLKVMMALSGQIVSHKSIIAEFSANDDDYDPHRLDALISRLRKRAEKAGLGELPLQSVRATGYIFTV